MPLNESTIREFLHHVHKRGMHPEDAARRIRVNYAVLQAEAEHNPALRTAWDTPGKEGAQTARSIVRQQSAQSNSHMQKAMAVKRRILEKLERPGGFVEKLIDMVEFLDITDKEDQRIMAKLCTPILSMLPKETLSHSLNLHKDMDKNPYANLTDEELKAIALKREIKMIRLSDEIDYAGGVVEDLVEGSVGGRRIPLGPGDAPSNGAGSGRSDQEAGGGPAVEDRTEPDSVGVHEQRPPRDVPDGSEPSGG